MLSRLSVELRRTYCRSASQPPKASPINDSDSAGNRPIPAAIAAPVTMIIPTAMPMVDAMVLSRTMTIAGMTDPVFDIIYRVILMPTEIFKSDPEWHDRSR
jgi:hypothetical protein